MAQDRNSIPPRNADIAFHLRQTAKASGSGRVYQSGGDQVVNEYNIYAGIPPLSGSAPVSVRPPMTLRPRRLHGRDSAFQDLGSGNLEPLLGNITVVHGMGGIGKTAIALEIARVMHIRGLEVFWIQASLGGDVQAGLRQIALQLSTSEARTRDVAAGLLNSTDAAWESLHARETPWLLVFDSADDPAEIERALGPGWLEGSTTGAVLVTTRQGNAEFWPPETRFEKLDALTPDAGSEMLLALSRTLNPSSTECDAAHALSERLGGIPLALRLAGLCISQPLSPLNGIQAFHGALDKDFHRVVDRAADTSLRPRADNNARELVMQTWEVSLDALEQQGIAHVRSIMRLLSCWASRPVPRDLISPKIMLRTHGTDGGPWTDRIVERALTALHAVGLIEVVHESATVRPVEHNAHYHWADETRTHQCVVVHPLVAEVNAAHLEHSPGRAHTWAAAARCLRAIKGMWGTASAAGYCQLVFPHLASLVGRLPGTLDDAFEITVDTHTYLSKYLALSGQYETGYDSSMRLHQRQEDFRSNDTTRFLIKFDHAEWAWRMSRLDEADVLAADACRLAETSVGSDSFLGLMARELAIAIHAERGFLESGEKMARKLCEELEGRPNLVQLSMQARHHLATILRESGRLEEAEEHSRLAVELMTHKIAPPFTSAVIRHELAVILWHRGHLHQALDLLREVLRLQQNILPPWHPSILITRYDVASIHAIMGNQMRALIDFTDIQLIEQETLGRTHRNTLQTKHQIGQILVELKELDQAESTLREVMEGYLAEGLQDRSADVLSTEHELVHIQAQRGKYRNAHHEWRKILTEERKSLGTDHPSTLRTHYNWALCWAALGFPGIARTEMRSVLTERRRTLGASHYETQQTKQMLADLMRLPPGGWRFGGHGRRNVPANREERRSNGTTSAPPTNS